MSNSIQLQTQNVNFGLMPQTFEGAMQFANIISKSSLLPRDYQNNPGNILSAIQYGSEIGLSPFQAMQSLAVINGRPSLYGDALLALVRSSGLLEYCKEEIFDDKAVCTVKRKNEPIEIIREFSKDDAKKAGLLNKSGPWSLYPKRMLQMRARAFALRDGFADVLRGVSSAEEMQDVEYTITDITPQSQPTLLLTNGKFISFLPKYFEYFQNNKDAENPTEELVNKIQTRWEISEKQIFALQELSKLETAPEDFAGWFYNTTQETEN